MECHNNLSNFTKHGDYFFGETQESNYFIILSSIKYHNFKILLGVGTWSMAELKIDSEIFT
jgi:hypothetical protein